MKNNIIDIKDLREKIDSFDKELLTTLSKRMALIPHVAEYKKANNVARYQPEREQTIIENRRTLAKKLSVNPDLAEKIMKDIIEDAHRIEKEIIGE